MKFSRWWALALWGAAALVSDAAVAQNLPNRPITVIMPFAGGSASDVVSRVLFNKMAAILGQPIVVENKPGAGGNLGTALAAKAAPDGYTLVGAASGPLAANLTLYKELGYDPQKQLVLISPFASFTIVVTASRELGVTTINGLINGTLMATALLILGVPLALPIGVLTFFGAYFPIVGSVATGTLAALVALASQGPVAALVVIGITVLIHNLEGYLVGPLVLGRAVHLHPLAVLLALAAGGVIAGIVGAFLAVPVTAVAVTTIQYYRTAGTDRADGTNGLAHHPTSDTDP